MAKVPVYGTDTIDAAPLPGVRQTGGASADMFFNDGGAGALGKALQGAGDKLFSIAIREQEKDNLEQIQGRDAKYKEGFLDWKMKAAERYKGVNADQLLPDYETWHKQTTEELGKDLGNEAQKRAFSMLMQKSYNLGRADFGTFVLGEKAKSRKGAYEATTAMEINAASIATLPTEVEERKKNVLNNINAYAASEGITGPQLDALRLSKTTDFHVARLRNMADKDYEGAKAYFDANKTEIAGGQHDEVEKLLKQGGLKNVAQKYADEVESLRMSEGNAIIGARQRFSGDEETAVVAEIKTRYAEQRTAREGMQREAADTAWGTYARTGNIKHIPSEVLAKMDGRDLESLRSHAKAKAEAGAAGIKTNMAAWVEVNDGIAAGSITSSRDILRYADRLSAADVKHFVEKVGRPDKIIEARIDKEDFEHVAQTAGLNPFDPKKTEEEKAALGELKYKIEQKIDQEQRDKKAPLSRKEKLSIMQQELDNQVIVKGFWGSPQKPAIMLTPDEQSKSVVYVPGKTGPEEVPLSKIPARYREHAIKQRKQRGLPITEQAIASDWVANGKPNK